MITFDIDPDVVRWGLQDLQVCVFSHSGASGSVTQYDKDDSQSGYIREGYQEPEPEPEHVNVENDVVIAHALQEELSRLAAAEASGFNNPSQDSILAQDWVGLPGRQHSSDQCDQQIIEDHNQGRGNELKHGKWDLGDPIISRFEQGGDSGVGDKISLGEHMLRIDTIDQSSVLDGQVEKRLNDMVAIPHVPKINGEIPSIDEETSDHQRLLDRLQLYGLVENKVQGDGNCQFRSLSDQLYRSQDHHKFVRQQVVYQLKSNSEMYEGYVPMAYGDYLKKMIKNGEWGDHVTLQAAADLELESRPQRAQCFSMGGKLSESNVLFILPRYMKWSQICGLCCSKSLFFLKFQCMTPVSNFQGRSECMRILENKLSTSVLDAYPC